MQARIWNSCHVVTDHYYLYSEESKITPRLVAHDQLTEVRGSANVEKSVTQGRPTSCGEV